MSALRDLRRAAARVLAASGPELAFAARAWLVAPVVEGALAGLGVRRTLEMVARLPRRRASRRRARVTVPDGALWVARAYAVHVVRGQCLPRAVVQHLLHRIDGTPSQLVIGVRRTTPSLDAHAWVEAPGGTETAPGFSSLLVVDDDGVHAARDRPS